MKGSSRKLCGGIVILSVAADVFIYFLLFFVSHNCGTGACTAEPAAISDNLAMVGIFAFFSLLCVWVYADQTATSIPNSKSS